MGPRFKFTPPAEMTGEDEAGLRLPADSVLDPIDIESEPVTYTPTGLHDWVNYFGAPDAFGPDGEPLATDRELFVVTKWGGKLAPKRMTVAQMVAAAGDDDFPQLYRLV